MHDAAYEFALRQGDNALILGHRLSEWCGHAPVLEEDIAMANSALDLIGQTQMWLGLAAEIKGGGTTADDLAYRRDASGFRNLLLAEQPNGHFGQTMMRQFLFDAFQVDHLDALTRSCSQPIRDIAAKCHKEALYHFDRTSTTVIALGDGTAQSNAKMQSALDDLWAFAGEMFTGDTIDDQLAAEGIAPHPSAFRTPWDARVTAVFEQANLTPPDNNFSHAGGKNGKRHTEHLGHILADMQFLQRAYPDAVW